MNKISNDELQYIRRMLLMKAAVENRSDKRIGRINITTKDKVTAIFTIQKFNAKGEITYQGKPFCNLVLNVGLDSLAVRTLYAATDTCNVGTGNTTPDVTDTGLTTYLASSATLYGSTVYTGTADDPMYISCTRVFSFPIGTFSGQNLAELGLSASANSDYFNHQLIKDSGGSPTTITPLADEGLRVTAEVRWYSDMQVADSAEVGSFLIGSDTFNYTRIVNSEAYTGTSGAHNMILFKHFENILVALGTSTADFTLITGEKNPPTSVTYNTYTPGDCYREATCVWAAANFVDTVKYIGVGYTASSTYKRCESIFTLTGDTETPAVLLTKSDIQELTLVVRREWGRH